MEERFYDYVSTLSGMTPYVEESKIGLETIQNISIHINVQEMVVILCIISKEQRMQRQNLSIS